LPETMRLRADPVNIADNDASPWPNTGKPRLWGAIAASFAVCMPFG
jgi:hypothetical protein